MTDLDKKRLEELQQRELRGIVIGGSAGSIDALNVILPSLAASLPVPVAVVVHLPPDRPSMLAELFAPRCEVAVRETADKDAAEPGVVFIAPPAYHLLIERDGVFSLSVDEPVHHSRPSVDVLFDSAAWAWRRAVLGILLSGANADGAAGLARIVEAGGVAWVQPPESSYATAMPRAGIAAVPEAHVLSLPEMASVLALFSRGRIAQQEAV